MIWSDPLVTPIAPEQAEELGTSITTPSPPQVAVSRQAVEPVLDVPHRTVSAGDAPYEPPQRFDLPFSPFRRLYNRLTGNGLRTTLLIPETQSDIDTQGKAGVMPVRQMNQPYEVHQPGPWYDSFVRQL